MENIVTFDLTDNFIARLADSIFKEYPSNGNDFSRLAFVFGGKKAGAVFEKRAGLKDKRAFSFSGIFSMDEFMGYCLAKKGVFKKISDLDGCYLAYNLTKEIAPIS